MFDDDEDDDDTWDWESIYFYLTEVSLREAETLPEYEPSRMGSNCLPQHWEMLFWNLRLDRLMLGSCQFLPVGGLPNGAGFGTHIKVSILHPEDPDQVDTLEAVLDDKTLEVHAVAPQWYWKYRWSVPSPIPEDIERALAKHR